MIYDMPLGKIIITTKEVRELLEEIGLVLDTEPVMA
jgi:hypothetical protein